MNLKTALCTPALAVTIVALVGGGCASTESNSTSTSTPTPVVKNQKMGSAELRGTLSYPSTSTLPPGATANVALVRSTYIEEAVEVLNSVIINPPGPSPIKFSVPYNPTQIKPGERYSVAARVFVDGKLIMRSNAYLVFNFGGPSNDLAIDLTPVK